MAGMLTIPQHPAHSRAPKQGKGYLQGTFHGWYHIQEEEEGGVIHGWFYAGRVRNCLLVDININGP